MFGEKCQKFARKRETTIIIMINFRNDHLIFNRLKRPWTMSHKYENVSIWTWCVSQQQPVERKIAAHFQQLALFFFVCSVQQFFSSKSVVMSCVFSFLSVSQHLSNACCTLPFQQIPSTIVKVRASVELKCFIVTQHKNRLLFSISVRDCVCLSIP